MKSSLAAAMVIALLATAACQAASNGATAANGAVAAQDAANSVTPATPTSASGSTTCQAASCPGTGPLVANYVCPDGAIAGPLCVPVNGACAWRIVSCPEAAADGGPSIQDAGVAAQDGGTAMVADAGGPDTSTCDACLGRTPSMPNYVCPDGTIGGPMCLAGPDGVCAWRIVSCP